MKRAKNRPQRHAAAPATIAPPVSTAPAVAPMRQMLLDIRPQEEPSLESFVCGGNGELLARLAALAEPNCYDMIYLWGAAGSGRSHLLRATAAKSAAVGRHAHYVAAAEAGDALPMPPGGLLIVDDVDRLPEAGQVALFRAFNTARLIGLALLLAGAAPPLQLALREDLRTRIGAALIYQVQPLSDAEKAETLARHAAGRGMRVQPETFDYLLRHAPRDLPNLMAVLDALDRASLENKRPVTLPLLRQVLNKNIPTQRG